MDVVSVLVVEDSLFFRSQLIKLLESSPQIKVIGEASNGKEAVEKTIALSPDVITMDINMPVMDGMTAIKEIMKRKATPIIMVSSFTSEAARETIDALSYGAIDFVCKKATFNEIYKLRDELVEKVVQIGINSYLKNQIRRTAIMTRVQQNAPKFVTPVSMSNKSVTIKTYNTSGRSRPIPSQIKFVIIGVSTGGPVSLQEVIPRLPKNFPACVLIGQHIPLTFSKSLAERLNQMSHIPVREAQEGDVYEPGMAYLCPGSMQMTLNKDLKISVFNPPSNQLYKPSIDQIIDSVTNAFGKKVLGVIMTGMGRDGADALRRLSAHGGYVVAQNEETCVVYGMPKAVIDEGTADEIHPLQKLAEAICECVGVKAVQPKTYEY